MPIYIESRDLDHPLGFAAEHQYLVYIPDGQEDKYDEWIYIGAFPSDRAVRDGSLLTGAITTNIQFAGASDDRWTIDEFTYFPDVIAVGTLLGKDPNDVTVAEMVAAGGYTGPVESIRHRELVNDGTIQSEEDLWTYLVNIANNISDQYTYKAEDITGTSNVFGPAANSNSFISSILRHAEMAGYDISAFNTDAHIPGSKTWLGTTGNDVLDGRIQFTNGDEAQDLFGGNGADTLYAGTNDSYLVAGKDMLRDTLIGNSGDDILVGYFNQNDLGQSDQMTGGDGDDTFVIIDPATALAGGIPDIQNITPAEGVFTHAGGQEGLSAQLDGGLGHDILDYSHLHGDVTVDFTDGSIANIEEYVGSSGDDTVFAGEGSVVPEDGGLASLEGGNGVDILSYRYFTDSVVITFNHTGLTHFDSVKALNIPDPENWTTRFQGFEEVEGSSFTDLFSLTGALESYAITGLDAGESGNFVDIKPLKYDDKPIHTIETDGDVLSLEGLVLSAGVTELNIDLGADAEQSGTLSDGTTTMSITGFESVLGTGVKDVIYGNKSGNLLFGFEGDDVLVGRSFSDVLVGDAGNDVLVGGLWDGVSFAEYQNDGYDDRLIGGAGYDTYLASAGDLIVDKSFQDFFSYQNFGGIGDGTIYFNGYQLGSAVEVDLLNNPVGPDVTQTGPRIAAFRDHENAILYHVFELVEHVTEIAADGSSEIVDYYSYLVGVEDQKAGEVIEIYDFNFTFDADFHLTGEGDHTCFGDFLGITLEQSVPIAGAIYGTDGNERLSGTRGDDIILGEGGDDTLSGGRGNDILEGGKGADKLSGGAGIDTIDYLTSSSSVWINMEGGTGSFGDASGDTFSMIENVSGSGLSDRISGDTGDNYILGRGGDDRFLINTNAGQDTFDGGLGSDTMVFYDTVDYGGITINLTTGINGGGAAGLTLIDVENIEGGRLAGNHILTGNFQHNRLYGGNANDQLFGMAGDDSLFGGIGNDIINGGGGNDLIYGNAGADMLSGGAGSDVFISDEKWWDEIGIAVGERDVITDFVSGEDLLDLSNIDAQRELGDYSGVWESNNDPFEFIGTNEFTTGVKGTLRYEHINGDTIVMADVNGDAVADLAIELKGVHNLSTDDFTSESVRAVINGTEGDDTLVGGTGPEAIYGLSGDDVIDGGAGNDLLYGDAGNDTIIGNDDDDTIYGGDGNDTIYGDDGNDYIDGGNGNDTIYGGSGDDQIIGGFGIDVMDGGIGNDTLDVSHAGAPVGGGIIDISSGTINWDNGQVDAAINFENIIGSQGDDTLIGTSGNNALNGGAGNDRLIGGAGYDWLTGGSGADIIELNFGDGRDRMYDFEDGIDIIDLSSTGLSFADLDLTNTDIGVEIGYEFSGGSNAVEIGQLELEGISASQISEADFAFA